jgi:hypothetical protein
MFIGAPWQVQCNSAQLHARAQPIGNPAPDDFAAARKLIASAFESTAPDQFAGSGYQHDHDEEFAWLWLDGPASKSPPTARQAANPTPLPVQKSERKHTERPLAPAAPVSPVPAPPTPAPPNPPRSQRPRDDAYWDDTADLVLDYFELLAGPDCGPLADGFVEWLKRSPDAHRRYVEGDDMDRASLVERYLKLRKLPRG